MKAILLSLTAATTLAIAATPAFATTGREAVNLCIEQKGCSWAVGSNGSIGIIAADGTVIACASAEAQCIAGAPKDPDSPSPLTNLTGLSVDGGNSGNGHTGNGPTQPLTSGIKAPTPTHLSQN